MSGHQGSQRLRRNGSPSINKSVGPLRATIPVSLMTQNVIHHPVLKNNPPAFGRSRQSPWKIKQCSPTLKVEKREAADAQNLDTPSIRRTASLDAIYLKGQWPRDSLTPKLLVDKSAQTPEEWQDERRYHHRGMEASPSRGDWKQKPKLMSYQQLNLPSIQYSPGSVSPNRVAASTNTDWPDVRETPPTTTCAIPVPSRTNQNTRVRNSVEGFNTEIEKLIRRGNEITNNTLMEPTPDGHRAPIAELFRSSSFRSVNTQTPVKSCSANSSSGNSSPCGSVSPLKEEIEDYYSFSPEDFQGLSLGTSPMVNRFLCREPPDGCEKVETLKALEQSAKMGEDLQACCRPKPNAYFVLPSSGSAFCSLNNESPSLKGGSSSHSCCPPSPPCGDRAGSVPAHSSLQKSDVSSSVL